MNAGAANTPAGLRREDVTSRDAPDSRSGASPGAVIAEVFGAVDTDAVRQQLARVLSLDVDGRGFPNIASRDRVVARLLQRYAGLRPVCFYSPYEAAVWAILSQRIQMRQAAALKSRLADALGEVVSIHGEPLHAFPSPHALVNIAEAPGLPNHKLATLRAIAAAALAGELDAARLRAMPAAEAIAHLRGMPGIGPFSAELILLRGAGHPDYLPLTEPRLRGAVRAAYGLDHEPTATDLERISDAWRPYRTWVAFLLRQSGAR